MESLEKITNTYIQKAKTALKNHAFPLVIGAITAAQTGCVSYESAQDTVQDLNMKQNMEQYENVSFRTEDGNVSIDVRTSAFDSNSPYLVFIETNSENTEGTELVANNKGEFVAAANYNIETAAGKPDYLLHIREGMPQDTASESTYSLIQSEKQVDEIQKKIKNYIKNTFFTT